MAWMIAKERSCQHSHTITDSTGKVKSPASFVRTHSCRVLAKVLGLVTAQNTSSLNLRSRAPGKLLVEVDNALHGDAIGVGANSLRKITILVSLFSGATTQNALISSPRRG